MFKHFSGSEPHSIATNAILNLVAQHFQDQAKKNRRVSMETILAIPGFSLPVKADYRFSMTTNNADGIVYVYNGLTSFIDWIATVRHGSVIVRGAETYPDHLSAAKGLEAVLA